MKGFVDVNRYAIDDASKDWNAAEKQIATIAKEGTAGVRSTVVSIMSNTATSVKRKSEFRDSREKEKRRIRKEKKVKR
jgi:N-acetyltransferase 10